MPPICPHRRPRKFQVISPRLYLRRKENLKSLRVHREDNAAFKSPPREPNITVEFPFILHMLLVKYEERVVLSVSEEEVCAYRNQYPVASQQNTANHFSLL